MRGLPFLVKKPEIVEFFEDFRIVEDRIHITYLHVARRGICGGGKKNNVQGQEDNKVTVCESGIVSSNAK